MKPVPLVMHWRAWLKYRYMRDLGDTEIFAYGISRSAELRDLSYIQEIVLIPQVASWAHYEVKGVDIARYVEERLEEYDQPPIQCSAIWLHTHPGGGPSSAFPSGIDENNWLYVHGQQPWSAMVILSRGGQIYARVRYGGGPPHLGFPAELYVDWQDFTLTDPLELAEEMQCWQDEYEVNVQDSCAPHQSSSSYNDELDRLAYGDGSGHCLPTLTGPPSMMRTGRIGMPAIAKPQRVMAKFTPQGWVRDYAIDLDGDYLFDVTEQVLAMGRDKALQIEDDSYEADELWQENSISDKHPHTGPFRVEVATAIQEFFKGIEGEEKSARSEHC